MGQSDRPAQGQAGCILRPKWALPVGTLKRVCGAGILLCLFSALLQGAPDFGVRSWQAEHGLPQAVVNAVIQTRDGYLWVGTFNGLAGFDGVRFKVFSAASTPELASDEISVLYEDRAGVLWIGTLSGGLTAYANGRFQHLSQPPELTHGQINAIGEDAQGRLHVATGVGLYLRQGSEFIRTTFVEGAESTSVSHFAFDSAGRLWLACRGRGLYCVEQGKARAPLPYTVVDALAADANGTVWLGADGIGLVRLEEGQPTIHSEFKVPHVRALHCSRDGTLWIGTQFGGLFRRRDGVLTRYTSEAGLSSDAVISICEDREDLLWLGTDGGGLNCLHARTIKTFSTRDGLSGNDTATILEDRTGKIWVGTYGRGLNVGEAGMFKPFTPPGLVKINAAVLSLCERRDGSIWIGASDEPPLRWDGQSLAPLPQFGANVTVLFEDREGGLWVGTARDGAFWQRNGETIRFHVESGLSDNHISGIVQDSLGAIWIGTAVGLNRVQQGRITAQYFTAHGLGLNSIQTLFVDRRGELWVGTAGGGLSRRRGSSFQTVTSAQGLPNDVVAQMLEDDHGYFWIGTNLGIFQIKREELMDALEGRKRFAYGTTYGKSDGMLHLECAGRVQPNCTRTRDGRLWFCTVGGVVMIDPKRVSPNPVPPPVYVESIEIDGAMRSVQTDRAASGSRANSAGVTNARVTVEPAVEVPPGSERIAIRYTGLSFVTPEQVRFRYKLEGLDSVWHDPGSQREVVYNHLQPGRYLFRVSACNNSGIWNEAGATLALLVKPFYWQTTWFKASALGAAATVAAWVVRSISLRKLRRRMALLEQRHAVEQERARIAQNMHDDLGARLTQISLLSGVARLGGDQPAELRGQLAKIGVTARDTIRALEEVIWAVDPLNDSTAKLLGFIGQFAETFLQSAGLRCRIDEVVEDPDVPVASEIRHHLYLTVKEALNNIVKHSGATEVRLRTGCAAGQLTVQVEDNGQGFQPDSPRLVGRGLKNMGQRIESIGGNFEISSLPGAGTSLRISVPVPRR